MTAPTKPPLACRLLGHRWSFFRDGATIRWRCERGCPAGGTRTYGSAAEAAMYFRHFARPPGPPRGLLAALGGTVQRQRRGRDG